MRKTETILEILRTELRDGIYPAATRFPSEMKLMSRFSAARLTINKITEQLVLEGFLERRKQGGGTFVREPNPFPLGHIAYLGPINNLYYSSMLDAIQRTTFLKGYALTIFSPGENLINYCIEKIGKAKYMGILVCGIGIIPYPVSLPLVYLDNGLPNNNMGLSSVTCDNYQGACDMAKTALTRGHREILIITTLSQIEYSRQLRVKGFSDTLKQYGIQNIEQRIFSDSRFKKFSAKRPLTDALSQFPETTLLLTDTDEVAVAVYQALCEMNLQDKIAVTGFGNINIIHDMFNFASVEQHPNEIGIQGVHELLKRIHDPSTKPQEITIETTLVNTEAIPWIR